MAEKLRSITNPIPWSLLLKPFAIVAAWLVLPWWAFLAVALYCYLVPLFRPLTLAPAFLVFLLMSLTTEPGLFWAPYMIVVAVLIFGMKDLVIVNRKLAYQLTVLSISFAGCLLLFGSFTAWSTSASFLYLALLALLWFWLIRSFPDTEKTPALPAAVSALILFEIGTVMFFLPINFFAQAVLLFLASVILFEASRSLGAITTRQAIAWGVGYAAISLLTVFLASWKV